MTAGLEHPGIVTVYDEGRSADGRRFYTMRLMRGQPLSRVLAERTGMAARLGLLSHYLDACQALAYAHAQGVIHRDLKPANIMLGAFGETQVVDWGLARRLGDGDPPGDPGEPAIDPGATQAGAVLGTPAYMSPEQARGEPADRRSDVWGLGAVLHELLTATPPLRVEPSQSAGAVTLQRLRAQAPDAPVELTAIVTRALAHDPRDRYPDAEALATDVAAYLAGRRVQAHRYTALELALRLARVWRLPLLIVGGALLVIATILVLGNLSLRSERDRARAAEHEARTALTTSDQHLATALVAQAHAADAQRANAAKEVIAAHALRLGESPEARGVLAGARAAARPTRLASAEIPSCRPLVALAVDDLLCADDLVLRRLTAGVERWRVTTTKPTQVLHVEAERVWAASPGGALTTLALATGAPDPGDWDFLDHNAGDLWPLPRGATGPARPDGNLTSSCPHSSVVGVSGHIDGHYVVLCGDGAIGPGVTPELPAVAPAFDLAQFITFTQLQLAPDGNRVVVAGTRGQVGVLDLTTRQTWHLPTDRAIGVRRLVVSPASDRVAIVRERGGVDLHELPTLQPLGTIPAAEVRDIRLFADGSVLVADARTITQWALPGVPWPALLSDEHGLSGVVFSPDGRSLLTTHGEGRTVLWDLGSGTRRHTLELGAGTVKAGTFSLDGTAFAVVDTSGGPPGPQFFATTTGALQWRPSTELVAHWHRDRNRDTPGQPPKHLMARRVVMLAGNIVVAALYAHGLLAVDLDTDDLAAITGCPTVEWKDLASAPDGQRAVLVSVDGAVFSLDPGAPIVCRLVPAPASSLAADISADAQTVVVGANGALARTGPAGILWSVPHPGPPPLDVSLSPDQRWIATAGPDDAARVFASETGALRAVLTGHTARVAAVDFSPDSARLATGSWDGAARLWDIATLEIAAPVLLQEAEATWGLGLDDALGR